MLAIELVMPAPLEEHHEPLGDVSVDDAEPRRRAPNRAEPRIDVVVVSYNNIDTLRQCVEALAGIEDVVVIVVDNSSTDGSLKSVADLPVERIQLDTNRGFGAGCNVGWRRGRAPYVLFLNPDARLDEVGVRRLADHLEQTDAGVAAPRTTDESGELVLSLRRFPTVASIFGQALFAHRLFPKARWVDEVIRDRNVYEHEAVPDWAAGACLLVRRELLEKIGGFDEGFFLYCEEIDLCRRLRGTGGWLTYTPTVTYVHLGGASLPRVQLLPVLVRSRIRYATKWFGPVHAFAYRLGVLLNAVMHVVFARSNTARVSHARSVSVCFRRAHI